MPPYWWGSREHTARDEDHRKKIEKYEAIVCAVGLQTDADVAKAKLKRLMNDR